MPRRKKVEAISKGTTVVESPPSVVASETEPAELREAMRMLNIDPWEVMSYRIYAEKVVIIQGRWGGKGCGCSMRN